MSEAVGKLIALLKRNEVWADPEHVELTEFMKDITENASNLLERIFLSTIQVNDQSKNKIVEFCINIIREEITKITVEIVGKEKEYQDPITLELMRDPVNLHQTGQLYERKPLERHLQMKKTCPLTGEVLTDTTFSSCVSIKSLVNKFVAETIEKTIKFGSMAVEILKVINIGVYNLNNYPLRSGFDQTAQFTTLIEPLSKILSQVVHFDEDNLEILKIQEECFFYSHEVPKLLEVRVKIVNFLNIKNRREESHEFLESKILKPGIENSLKNVESGLTVYRQEKENLLRLSFEYYLRKRDFGNILSAVKKIANFFIEVNETGPYFRYLKKAETVLARDRTFLKYLSNLFESGPFRKKKQSARIYYHLAMKFEDEKRYFEETRVLFESSLRLNPKNQKVKVRYDKFLKNLEERKWPKKQQKEEDDDEEEKKTSSSTPKGEQSGEQQKHPPIRKIEDDDDDDNNNNSNEPSQQQQQQQQQSSSSSSEEEEEQQQQQQRKKKKKKGKRRRRGGGGGREKSRRSYKSLQKRISALSTTPEDTKKKTKVLLKAYREDPDSEFLCSQLVQIYQNQGDLSKVIQVTSLQQQKKRKRKRKVGVGDDNDDDIDEDEDENDDIDEVMVFKYELRTQSLLQAIDSANKKVEKLKDVLVKISKDFNRKLRILNLQYKDVRTHLQQHESILSQKNSSSGSSNITPMDSPKGKKRKNRAKKEGSRATLINQKFDYVVKFEKPKLGKHSDTKKLELSGIKFEVNLLVDLGMGVKMEVNVEMPDWIVGDEEYQLTVEFKTIVAEKFLNKNTRFLTFTEFTYYSDTQWLFKFQLKRLK